MLQNQLWNQLWGLRDRSWSAPSKLSFCLFSLPYCAVRFQLQQAFLSKDQSSLCALDWKGLSLKDGHCSGSLLQKSLKRTSTQIQVWIKNYVQNQLIMMRKLMFGIDMWLQAFQTENWSSCSLSIWWKSEFHGPFSAHQISNLADPFHWSAYHTHLQRAYSAHHQWQIRQLFEYTWRQVRWRTNGTVFLTTLLNMFLNMTQCFHRL